MTATTEDNDYGAFQNAGAVYPLDPDSVNSLLRDADPALFFGLDFWSFLITHYLGDRLIAAAKRANFAGLEAAVAQRYPWEPDLELAGNQFKFPLLAVWRKTAQHKRTTVGWESDRGTFDLLYALPPLTAGQAEQLLPILHAIAAVIRHGTTQSFDPAYTPPGGNLGDSPWDKTFAGIAEFGFDESTFGLLPGTGNLKFPALIMSGYTLERDFRLPGQTFDGADLTVALGGTAGPVIAQVSTHQPPAIVSVAPSSGAVAGGTVVTIRGTGFTAGATALFGTAQVLATVSSDGTTVTCASPPGQQLGAVDVTVIDVDGQTVTASGAFTYA